MTDPQNETDAVRKLSASMAEQAQRAKAISSYLKLCEMPALDLSLMSKEARAQRLADTYEALLYAIGGLPAVRSALRVTGPGLTDLQHTSAIQIAIGVLFGIDPKAAADRMMKPDCQKSAASNGKVQLT
jgi:hypothetical protein